MSKTINGMNASQLKELLKTTIENINTIDSSISIIESNLEKSNNSDEKISNLLFEIKDSYYDLFGFEGDEYHEPKDSKIEEIEKAYNEIIIGDEDTEKLSLKKEIEDFVIYIEGKKGEINEFKNKIFGYTKRNPDNGTEEKVLGLFDNINDFHKNQKEKFNTLYNKIDEELEAGTTSVALAKVFSDKVLNYKNENNKWSNIFIFIIIFMLGYYAISSIGNTNITNLSELWFFLLLKLPFFGIAIWLLIFVGNRRAEAKKLEEGYKHKEVMARSFIGYKKSIEELEGNLGDNDKELMRTHMSNLLKTINQDTSSFLNSKGDNHPFLDLFTKIFSKDNFPKGSLENDFGKIEFNKK